LPCALPGFTSSTRRPGRQSNAGTIAMRFLIYRNSPESVNRAETADYAFGSIRPTLSL
jgi:hypothetical protein